MHGNFICQTSYSVQYCEFVVEGKPMEFMSSYVHFGHLLTDRLDDSCDISIKEKTK